MGRRGKPNQPEWDTLNKKLIAAVNADISRLAALSPLDPQRPLADSKKAIASAMVRTRKVEQSVASLQARLANSALPSDEIARRRLLQALDEAMRTEFAAGGEEPPRDYLAFLNPEEYARRAMRDEVDAMEEEEEGRVGEAEDDRLADLSQDLLARATKRDNFLNRLPRLRVPCIVYSATGRQREIPDAIQVAKDFVRVRDNSLLVVLGEFGSGKSELLRRAAETALQRGLIPILLAYTDLAPWLATADATSAVESLLDTFSTACAAEFRSIVAKAPEKVVVLIDAFDEANLSVEVADPGPDLQRLSSLLTAGVKVAVATRRSVRSTPAQFLNQIGPAALRRELGVKACHIVELLPCELDQVDGALTQLPPEQAQIMRDYLSTSPHIQMDRVRRPLVLQMLIDLPASSFSANETFSIYRLYDVYAETILDREGDRTGSPIPTDKKREMLRHVAREMFFSQLGRAEARVARERLQHIIQEEVSRPANAEWAAEPTSHGHDWFLDFIRSTPLVVPAGPRRDFESVFEFVHHSLFEFFLTQHFVEEFHAEQRFGLQDNRHSVRAFDSLLPYFIRAQFVEQEHILEELAVAPTTSNLDRLLAFFLIEDSPRILDLLHRSVEHGYLKSLNDAETRFESYFMKKVVRFQLVLLDDGIGRALSYVADARRHEVDQQLDIEVHTFAAGQRPTDFLLKRTRNPQLQNALPIFVYRLGQFGDARAIDRLETLKSQSQEPMFHALVDEAIASILMRDAVTP